jgi:hypothetical protein
MSRGCIYFYFQVPLSLENKQRSYKFKKTEFRSVEPGSKILFFSQNH